MRGVAVVIMVCGACSPPGPQLEFHRTAFATESDDSIFGELGFLAVPSRHAQPGEDSILLAVARFAASTDAPGDPIIYLEGGPGAAGIHPERMALLGRLRNYGDVITFDQRGTGQSRPLLECGEAVQLPDGEPPTRDLWLAAEMREARRCAADLRARGVDLADFNVLESVEDVEAIRVALGADRIRLVGISFGSHLGLAVLKRHGERVSRAVFAGVEGLHQTFKLPSTLDLHLAYVSDLIAKDPVAGSRLPDLEGLVRTTAADLDRAPRRIEVDGDTVTLTGFKFRRLVAGSIVRRQFLRFALEEFGPIRDGDFLPLARIASSNRVAPFGMRAAMDCGSGVAPSRWSQIERERATTVLQGVADFPFPDVCEAWGVNSLGSELWAPFHYQEPILFVTGGLDGLTPVSNVDELRPSFPNSSHLIVRRMGHEGPGLWFATPEVLDLVGAFLVGTSVPDAEVSAPPIDWETGAGGG